MKKKLMSVLGLVTAGVMALGLIGCGAGNPTSTAPAAESTAAASTAAEATGLKIGIVTTSGVDDGSFNENCYDGIKAFVASHPDCSVKDVKESDLSKVIETVGSLVGDYDVLVLPGFNFAAIGEIAQANSDKYFIVVFNKVVSGKCFYKQFVEFVF